MFRDDPGAGTPALVILGDATATYNCALGEGELDGGRKGMVQLTDSQMAWLDGREEEVEEFLWG